MTDDYPTFFLPRMLDAAAARLDCRLEAIDSNGLMPMRATTTVYPTAYAFRRYLQKSLPAQFSQFPLAASARGVAATDGGGAPATCGDAWPEATDALLAAGAAELATLPIDHTVPPSPVLTGGSTAAHERLTEFIAHGLHRYGERNQPDSDAASGLSPWLHFGHIAAHRVFSDVVSHAGWTTRSLATKADGKREGWWGAPPHVEGVPRRADHLA